MLIFDMFLFSVLKSLKCSSFDVLDSSGALESKESFVGDGVGFLVRLSGTGSFSY